MTPPTSATTSPSPPPPHNNNNTTTNNPTALAPAKIPVASPGAIKRVLPSANATVIPPNGGGGGGPQRPHSEVPANHYQRVKRNTVVQTYKRYRNELVTTLLADTKRPGTARLLASPADALEGSKSMAATRDRIMTIAAPGWADLSAATALGHHQPPRPQQNQSPLHSTKGAATSGAAASRPSKIHLSIDLKTFHVSVPPGTEEFEMHWTVKGGHSGDQSLYELCKMTLGADARIVPGRTRTIFQDLPLALNDMILVCKLYRKGPVVAEEEKKDNAVTAAFKGKPTAPQLCRRPVATGIVELGTLNLRPDSMELMHTMYLYTCADETAFCQLPQALAARSTGGSVSGGADANPKLLAASKGINVGISLLTGSADDAASQFKSLVVMGGVPITRPLALHLGHKDTARNELFIFLKEASFITKKKPSDLQVVIRIVQNESPLPWLARGSNANPSANTAANNVSPSVAATTTATTTTGTGAAGAVGSGSEPIEVASFVIRGSNTPRWEESFCIKLPYDVLRLTVDRGPLQAQITVLKITKDSKKEIARGVLLLVDSTGTMISDGIHTVHCAGSKVHGLRKMADSQPRNGFVKIKTHLISNQLIRNTALARVGQWRILRMHELVEVVQKLPHAADEIPLFLSETLDHLLGILDNLESDELSKAIYTSLSFIVDQVCDEKRFKEHRAMLLKYIAAAQTHAITRRVGDRLLRAMTNYFSDYRAHPVPELLVAVSALDVVFKIIRRARQLPLPSSGEATDARQHFLAIGQGWQRLVAATEATLAPCHGVLLKRLHQALPFLLEVLSRSDVAQILVNLTNSMEFKFTKTAARSSLSDGMPEEDATNENGVGGSGGGIFGGSPSTQRVSHGNSMLLAQGVDLSDPVAVSNIINDHYRVVEKLAFIEHVLAGAEFGFMTDKDARAILWPGLLNATLVHLIPVGETPSEFEEIELQSCLLVLQRMISLVQKGTGNETLLSVVLPSLPRLFNVYHAVQRHSPSALLLSDVSIVILALLFVTPLKDLTHYINTQKSVDHQKHLLADLGRCLSAMLSGSAPTYSPFPINWSEIISFHYRVCYQMVMMLGSILKSAPTLIQSRLGAIPPLLRNFLLLSLSFVNSPHMQVDNHGGNLTGKRSNAEMLDGIMSMTMALWTTLPAEVQLDLSDDISAPILRAALIFTPPTIAQRAGKVYQGLLQRDFLANQDLSKLKTLTIHALVQHFESLFASRSRGRAKEFATEWFRRLSVHPSLYCDHDEDLTDLFCGN
jgi:hypothetical protein